MVTHLLRREAGMTTQPTLLRFGAFNLSLDVIRLLRPLVGELETRDRDLARQLRRAASSVALNAAESRGRVGKDARHLLRVALGSAEESAGCLYVADAWGYLDADQTRECLAKLTHLLAVLAKLTR